MSPITADDPLRPRTFVALDHETRQRGLIAEVHPAISGEPPPALLRDFERRLFDRNVQIGLLVTPAWCYVIRDLVVAMDFDHNRFERTRIETPLLLESTGGRHRARGLSFAQKVRAWLDAVAASWNSVLPHEAVPLMIPEVVGNLAQADVEELDDVLTGDAA